MRPFIKASTAVVVVVVALATGACPKTDEPAPKTRDPIDLEISAADKACTKDADCVVSAEDCCACSGGAGAVAIRADHKATQQGKLDRACAGMACPQVKDSTPGCLPAARAACRNAVCVVDAPLSTTEPPVPDAAPTKPTPVEPIR